MAIGRQSCRRINLPSDWLNDAAKGFLSVITEESTVLNTNGICVTLMKPVQMLALKLCAWRDDVDVNYAACLLKDLSDTRSAIWNELNSYLVPGCELKAEYAFNDLWQLVHDNDTGHSRSSTDT